jgi:hypothetical protein
LGTGEVNGWPNIIDLFVQLNSFQTSRGEGISWPFISQWRSILFSADVIILILFMIGSLEMWCNYFYYGYPMTSEDQTVLLFVKKRKKENKIWSFFRHKS